MPGKTTRTNLGNGMTRIRIRNSEAGPVAQTKYIARTGAGRIYMFDAAGSRTLMPASAKPAPGPAKDPIEASNDAIRRMGERFGFDTSFLDKME